MSLEILKQKTILYVEDDKAIIDAFEPVLKKMFKEVMFASDGKEGLKLFKENKHIIDFVVTDIKMPVMDGLEMSEKIKELSSSTPCILLTAHGQYDYFLKADEIGIFRYLQKPLNIKELIDILLELVSKKS